MSRNHVVKAESTPLSISANSMAVLRGDAFTECRSCERTLPGGIWPHRKMPPGILRGERDPRLLPAIMPGRAHERFGCDLKDSHVPLVDAARACPERREGHSRPNARSNPPERTRTALPDNPWIQSRALRIRIVGAARWDARIGAPGTATRKMASGIVDTLSRRIRCDAKMNPSVNDSDDPVGLPARFDPVASLPAGRCPARVHSDVFPKSQSESVRGEIDERVSCRPGNDALPFALAQGPSLEHFRNRGREHQKTDRAREGVTSTQPNPIKAAAVRRDIPPGPKAKNQPLADNRSNLEQQNLRTKTVWGGAIDHVHPGETETVARGARDFVTLPRKPRERKRFCAPASGHLSAGAGASIGLH